MLFQLSHFLSPLFPSTLHPPPTSIPPPQFMSIGHTYKFLGFSIFHTTLNLPLSILYLPFMLLIPCSIKLTQVILNNCLWNTDWGKYAQNNHFSFTFIVEVIANTGRQEIYIRQEFKRKEQNYWYYANNDCIHRNLKKSISDCK